MRIAAIATALCALVSGIAFAADAPDPPDFVTVAERDGQTVFRAHAIAMHGWPKYAPDFEHFEYVDPSAPKGGAMRTGAEGTFDSFNPYISKGTPVSIGGDMLTTSSADEPFTRYGLVAEEIEWPEDRSWVIFHLRPEARWHDGTPVSVEDVIFSLETLKAKGRPVYRFYYQSIERAEKVGPRSVKFVFSEAGNRELPLIAGELPLLPKHYWEENDFDSTTRTPPLTSGPYKITNFEPGRFVVRERVKDYWGADLPVNRGQNNLAIIRTDYFRDATVIREALKAGSLDFRSENQAKAWATAYDIAAVREGWLNQSEIEHQRPTGMQAFIFNTRRPIFQDVRVREAIGLAFDFEWTNPALFFGQYTRNYSYFGNSELASRGLPEGEELEILEGYRGRIPDEVFTAEFTVPTTDGSGWPRENLKRAFALLEEAGWVVRDQKLVNAETSQPFQFEFLLVSKAFERIVLPFARNLGRLGIDVRVRLVDTSQYINRLRSFDFDMISLGWGQSDSPGNEQRSYWTTAAADSPAARNYAGIKDPVVDELVELLITAPSRESLVARTRALDRVLLRGHYVVPAWHARVDRLLYWDKYARPEVTPKNGTSVDFWWFDATKAAALEAQERAHPEMLEDESEERPSVALTLFVAALLIVAAYLVVRQALRRRPAAG